MENGNLSEKKSLSEKASKELLKQYNIPIVDEVAVLTEDAAVEAAQKIGFPVVLKGLGAKLLHKTERGLVHLKLTDPQSVRKAAVLTATEAGDELEGFLVQPQISGNREFVAGLFRDEQFGPVIMFGVGGILTEAISDVSFRLAPLTETDAEEMLEEIKAKSLLEEFRGENAANRDQLIQTLMGLSRISTDRPDIVEVDINPLVVNPIGDICAVDALVILGEAPPEKESLPPVDPILLRKFFHPRSIAFVGATGKIGKWGHTLLCATISKGYKGDIYLVNPKGGTIAGRPVYKTIKDIPGKVDLGVVTIPAVKVIDLIPQFKEKEIKNMLLITSGFAETGEEGRKIEQTLVEKAREAEILLLGPNTMGICNPHIHLYCLGTPMMAQAGSTSVVAQSGNIGTQLLAYAEQQGIGIRCFSGSGNEAMITIEDYLEGLELDDVTRTIVLYIESVKNGRRFFDVAQRVGKKKPIVLLKGGRTLAGKHAAASHTGALASDSGVFNAMCRQTGIVNVEYSMDLLDLSAAFSSLPLPKGNRAAIMSLGGGWGVVATDLCAEHGLEIPKLPREIVERIDRVLPPYWSRSNPVDLVGDNDNSIPMIITEELLKWDGCDAVINLGIIGRTTLVGGIGEAAVEADPNYSPEFLKSIQKDLIQFEEDYIQHIVNLMKKYDKPIFGVSIFTVGQEHTLYRVKDTHLKGVFYPTPERAVKVFAKMYEYQQVKSR